MKLSVVVITYNHERFVGQALESVLAQRVNFEYEIVIAEDCSTDRTREIVSRFCSDNPRRAVPLFRSRNVGGAQNAREAFESCRGEYVAVLEGDDYWTCSEKLQRQVDFLDQNPDYSMCCHRVRIQDETGKGRTGLLPPLDVEAGPYTIEDVITRNLVTTCAAMYRSNSVRSTPNWLTDIIPGDWARHILVAHCGKIQLMDEAMAVYRIHPRGMWTSKSLIDQMQQVVHMFEVVDRHLNFQYTSSITRVLAVHYFEMAAIERQNGNRAAVRKHLAACIRAGRFRLPGRFIDWAALLGYGVLGVKRIRWWKHGA